MKITIPVNSPYKVLHFTLVQDRVTVSYFPFAFEEVKITYSHLDKNLSAEAKRVAGNLAFALTAEQVEAILNAFRLAAIG